MWGWEARSSGELHERLKAIPADVPQRGQGRTSEHVERYVIRDVLWTLANATGLLPYPLSIEKGESPDFDLRSSAESIGVEITEAIPPNLAHAVAIQTEHYPDAALDVSLFAWDSPALTKEEIHVALRRQGPRGAGWAGDAAEREWANVIAAAVRHKIGKLNGPTFRRPQDKNWLAVYDNAPQPVWDLDRAIENLSECLGATQQDGLSFDRVFIERPIGVEPNTMLMVEGVRVSRLRLHRP